MAGLVTEVLYLPLLPGTDLTTGDSKAAWDDVLKTIASAPGVQSLYWGAQIENPDTVQLLIEWDSLDSHKKFQTSPEYGPFMERNSKLLAGAPTVFHIKLPEPFSISSAAPITECVSLYFDPSHSTSAYDANWAKFLEAANADPGEAEGVIGGWGIEEHQHANFGAKEGEEGPAKYFSFFVRWPSREAHFRYRERKEYPETMKYVRDGPKAVQLHHVQFTKY